MTAPWDDTRGIAWEDATEWWVVKDGYRVLCATFDHDMAVSVADYQFERSGVRPSIYYRGMA